MKFQKKLASALLTFAMLSTAAVAISAANTIDAYEGTITYSGVNAVSVDGSQAGEVISGGVSYDAVAAAFDGDMATQASFDSNYGTDVSNWMGMKTEVAIVPTQFRLAASSAGQQSKIMNSYIQASKDGVNWITLKLFSDWREYATPAEGGWWAAGTYKEVAVSSTEAYQYFRYFNYNDDGANRLTEFQVFGVVPTSNTIDTYEGEIVYTGVNATSVAGSIAGEIIGGGADAATLGLAFDGSLDTTAFLGTNVGTDVSYWMGIKADEAVVPTAFRLSISQHYRIMGSYIQGSNDGVNWDTLVALTDWRDYATPDEGGVWFGEDSWKYCEVNTTTAYQYYRYFNYNDQGGNRLAEFQVYTADAAVAGAANNVVKFNGTIVESDVVSTYDADIVGEPVGAGVSAADLALIADGNTATGAFAGGNTEEIDTWFGIKFECPVVASEIKIAVPDGQANYRVYGSYFQASNDGVNWKTLEVFDSWRDYSDYTAGNGSYKTVAVADANAYTYFRYFNHNDIGANRVGEFQVYGTVAHSGETTVTGKVDATTDAEGYTGDTVCADCGAVLAAGEAIAKISSRYYTNPADIVYTGLANTSVAGAPVGEIIAGGVDGSAVAAAFDGDIETMAGLSGNPNAIGGEGEGNEAVPYWMGLYFADGIDPSYVRFALPSGQANYRAFWDYIQASVDGENWVDLYVFDDWRKYDSYTSGQYLTLEISDSTVYKYFRVYNYEDRGGNRVGEFQVFGPEGILTNSLTKYVGEIVYTGTYNTSVGGSAVGEIVGGNITADGIATTFDGNTATEARQAANTNDIVDTWFGLYFEEAIVPTGFRVSVAQHYRIMGSYIQASNDGMTWTTLEALDDWRDYATPDEGGVWFGEDAYKNIDVNTTEAYKYFRYFNYNDNGGNWLAEFQVFTADEAVAGAANNSYKFNGEIVASGVASTYSADIAGEPVGAGVSAGDLALIADGNTATGAFAGGNTEEIDTWFGIKFCCPVVASEIKIAVPDGQANYRVYGSYFQASNDGVNWKTLEVFDSWRDYNDYTAANGSYKTVAVADANAYTYFRYFNYNDHGANRVGEFQVYGTIAHEGEALVGGACYETVEAAFAAAVDGDTVKVLADAEIGVLTVAKNTAITLDLNGKTLTGVDTTAKNFGLIQNNGTLTVKDSGNGGSIQLTATTNSGWNRYSAVISNNPGGTLVVEGGTLKHLGGTDMAYGIDSLTNGTIGAVSVTINGGAVESTYRGIRQFCNSTTTENVLVVNGGEISGANKSIWLQSSNNKANLGSLTVGDKAALTGDVYVWTAENTAEFVATVSVATAAFEDGYTLITGNLPEGVEALDYAGVIVITKPVNSGVCGEALTWTFDENGTLAITGNGAMYDFNYSVALEGAAPWAAFRADVKKVVISGNVNTIGTYAFFKMANLTEVVFEGGACLTSIGQGAFGYTGIKNITIPADDIEIAANAFYFAKSLETVAFEEGSVLASIGNYAFRDCSALQTLYIPETVGTIGTNILYNAKQATVSVANGSYAHKYATTYGYNVEVRDSVSVIASGACGADATWYLTNDGVLYIEGAGAMDDFDYTTVADNAAPWAKMRADVKKVVIGKDITSIGTYAFFKMANLIEVEFEAGSALEVIGTGAFGYTTALKNVVIPASVVEIKQNAFYFGGLETAAFAEGSVLKTIGNYAFRNNTALTEIDIPDSVANIGAKIFYKCDAVTVTVGVGTAAEAYMVKTGVNHTIRLDVIA